MAHTKTRTCNKQIERMRDHSSENDYKESSCSINIIIHDDTCRITNDKNYNSCDNKNNKKRQRQRRRSTISSISTIIVEIRSYGFSIIALCFCTINCL